MVEVTWHGGGPEPQLGVALGGRGWAGRRGGPEVGGGGDFLSAAIAAIVVVMSVVVVVVGCLGLVEEWMLVLSGRVEVLTGEEALWAGGGVLPRGVRGLYDHCEDVCSWSGKHSRSRLTKTI